jgi:hypothetical protein
MQQSKNVALAFLLGTFLTGGALGFTANRYMTRDKVCTTGRTPLAERLSLSPEQSRAVDSILDERGRQYGVIMAPVKPAIDSVKLNARQQIKRLLSQQQAMEFDALIREMNDSTRKDKEE